MIIKIKCTKLKMTGNFFHIKKVDFIKKCKISIVIKLTLGIKLVKSLIYNKSGRVTFKCSSIVKVGSNKK